MAEKKHLEVEGMTCTNCALGVSRFLEKQGLQDVSVNFSTGDVYFEETQAVDMDLIRRGISGLGYHVRAQDNGHGHLHDEPRSSFTLERKLMLCIVFTVPLLLHMLFQHSFLSDPWVQLLLCLPVFVTGMMHFGKSSWLSLKSGVPNMDVLIVIGSVSAFIYSLAGMVLYMDTADMHHYLFFETTATIITLVLLGNVIEKRSVRQTTTAIRELASLQPVVANKIIVGGDMTESITEVKASEIKKGDPVLVNSGAVIPVDGTIYWGSTTVDESALTGESLPVDKNTGDSVLAGSIALGGSIKVLTEHPGGQTLLAGILELVKQAQMSKPAIQKLGDRISAWFIPVVVSIAVLTFATGYFFFGLSISKALMSSIAVLVISCPCAMGLATPTAVAVGLGKAAKKGILVKGGETLEQFGSIKTAVLDKTGTLTSGEFRVSGLHPMGEFSEQEIINTIISLEQHSEHPIARSVLKSLGDRATAWVGFKSVDEQKGLGISALDDKGNRWILGSLNAQQGIGFDPGHTIYLSCNGNPAAALDLTDDLRNGASEMIRELRDLGIEPILVSGDSAKRCEEIANAIGIKKVYSGMLPHQKTEIINQLKLNGKVIMVGDGINDAPSLAAADIGISFGQATQIAVNSAQVIIIDGSDLRKITLAIRLGKKTLLTIRQNLFWAFFYNVVAIPIAAFGLLSPMIAALSMAFSDVVVIGNSLRLKLTKSH